MLGAAGEHAIGLGRRLGHQIVYHHADVRLVAAQDEIGLAMRDKRAALMPATWPWAAASS